MLDISECLTYFHGFLNDILDSISEPEEEWISSDILSREYEEDVSEEMTPPDDHLMLAQSSDNRSRVLSSWLALFLLQLQASYRISSIAINSLFQFLSTFFHILSSVFDQLKQLVILFPSSLYLAK